MRVRPVSLTHVRMSDVFRRAGRAQSAHERIARIRVDRRLQRRYALRVGGCRVGLRRDEPLHNLRPFHPLTR